MKKLITFAASAMLASSAAAMSIPGASFPPDIPKDLDFNKHNKGENCALVETSNGNSAYVCK
jgi:hypothetical protein